VKVTRRQLKNIILEQLRSDSLIEGTARPRSPKTSIRIEFEAGQSDTQSPKAMIVNQTGDLQKAFDIAVSSSREDFKSIKITAGTSGSGTRAANEAVLQKRIDAALKLILDEVQVTTIPSGITFGTKSLPPGMTLDPATIKNMATVEMEVDTVQPGQSVQIPGAARGRMALAPDDPNDPFWYPFQFVEIEILHPGVDPRITRLAARFIEATLRTAGPAYAKVPVLGTFLPLTSEITDILSDLRNKAEFDAFNQSIKDQDVGFPGSNERDFYDIAKTTTLNVPGGIVGAFLKPYGMNPLGYLKQKALGPVPEIPGGIDEINDELERLNASPLL